LAAAFVSREQTSPLRSAAFFKPVIVMNKAACLFAALAAFIAQQATANDSVSVTVTGTVAPRCEVSGFVRQIAGENSTAIGIGYDVNTGVTGQTFASSRVQLGITTPQLLADVTARCNTGTATFSMATDNNFRLRNPAGVNADEIPFVLNLIGQGGAAGIAAPFTTVLTNTGPNQPQVRPLQFVLPVQANPAMLTPGTYSDTIRVTITPNP
jgi:hypothetical protein